MASPLGPSGATFTPGSVHISGVEAGARCSCGREQTLSRPPARLAPPSRFSLVLSSFPPSSFFLVTLAFSLLFHYKLNIITLLEKCKPYGSISAFPLVDNALARQCPGGGGRVTSLGNAALKRLSGTGARVMVELCPKLWKHENRNNQQNNSGEHQHAPGPVM